VLGFRLKLARMSGAAQNGVAGDGTGREVKKVTRLDTNICYATDTMVFS